MTSEDALHYDPDKRQLVCRDNWNIKHIPALQVSLNAIEWPTEGEITFDGSAITKMDSSGAWLLVSLMQRLKQNNIATKLKNFSKEHLALIEIVKKSIGEETQLPAVVPQGWVTNIGQVTTQSLFQARDYLTFIGQLTYEVLRMSSNPARIRWNSFVSVVYQTGFLALPIIALLSFMIGVVIAYQMGLQLKNYGANIYIVDLQGLAVLREFGPLLTAIMVAGRTGSAFTAQLGIMKINEEIDALDTMGVTPAELLLLPRIIGLFVALPLLTIWSDIFGVAGGIFMANNMLGITPYDFLHRFPQVIHLKALLIGLGKAPVFALIISSIGCFEGMKVEGSADSVGRNTTRSVVLAIFFIIVVDAVFSVIFSKLKL